MMHNNARTSSFIFSLGKPSRCGATKGGGEEDKQELITVNEGKMARRNEGKANEANPKNDTFL